MTGIIALAAVIASAPALATRLNWRRLRHLTPDECATEDARICNYLQEL